MKDFRGVHRECGSKVFSAGECVCVLETKGGVRTGVRVCMCTCVYMYACVVEYALWCVLYARCLVFISCSAFTCNPALSFSFLLTDASDLNFFSDMHIVM